MDKFERLNRETREHNNRNVNRYNPSSQKQNTSFSYFQYLNNQTYKQNNNQYSRKYF